MDVSQYPKNNDCLRRLASKMTYCRSMLICRDLVGRRKKTEEKERLRDEPKERLRGAVPDAVNWARLPSVLKDTSCSIHDVTGLPADDFISFPEEGMSLLSASRKLVSFVINTFPSIAVTEIKFQIIPQRILHAQTTRNYSDKFSIAPKKKKARKNIRNSSKASLKQSQVFQLDPLRGQDAPEILDSARQQAVSGAILQGVTDVLNGPELDSGLRDCQLEITQVRLTPDLGHATIYWTVSGEIKGNLESIQNMLNENTNYIRRLLPAYSSLARFPQLVFTKDHSAEYETEMEYLLHKAKQDGSSPEKANKSE